MTTPAASTYNGGIDGYRANSGGDFKPLARSIRKPKSRRKSSVKGRKRRENIAPGSFRQSVLGVDLISEKSKSNGNRNTRHQTMVDTGDKNRSKNMQEYLPDSIVACINSWEAKNINFNDESLQLPKFNVFNTVCLFIDLAGFTSLTENLNNKLGSLGLNARAAIEALVEKLNELYSKMLNIILKHGGDATRFAGDAIEVIWPFVPNANVDIIPQVSDNTIVASLKCALALSQSVSVLFDQVEFDFKKLAKYYKEDFISQPGQSIREKFKVRIGVGIGEVVILHIGGADDNVMKCRHEYICFGPAISQAHDCERNAEPGETVVHTGDFKRLRLMKRFRIKEIEGSDFSVLTHQRHATKRRSKKDSSAGPVKHNVRRMQKSLSYTSGIHLKDQLKIMSMNSNLSSNVERMLWRYVPIAAVPYIGEAHHEEWLPEFRTVTTLFCNLGISPDDQLLPILEEKNRPNLLDDFQQMFLSIQQCVFRFEGTINKFLVDKGSVIMVVFGLPPFGHVDDAKRGVLCAKGIMKILTSFHEGLDRKSDDKPTVGVTTGTVLCGVIGSYAYYSKHRVSTKGGKNWGTLKANQVEKKKHARREYSIIGDSVNVASRLMVLARQLDGSLLIDETTVSSLRKELLFKGPEFHEVKGKANKIAVYQLAPSGERYRSKIDLHRGTNEGLFSFGNDEDIDFDVSNAKVKDKRIMFGKSMRMASRGLVKPRFFSSASILGKSQTYPAILQEMSAIRSSFCYEDNSTESSQVQFVFLEGQVGVGKSHLLFHALDKDESDDMSLFTAFGNAYKTSKEGNMFGTIKYLLQNMLERIREETDMKAEDIVTEALVDASDIINKSAKPVNSSFEEGNEARKEAVANLSSLTATTKSILKDILGNCFEESASYLDTATHRLTSFLRGGLHIETIDCILGFAKRKNLFGVKAALILSPVVELISALFVGFATQLAKRGKPLVCVVEESQNMDLLCWLIFAEICMFYSATKALFVFSRTTLMLQEDEFQIYKSQETVSAYNCNSIFGKFSSTKLQNQHRGIFHYREKFEANRASVKFLRLNCSGVFTKAIISAHFDVAVIDSRLVRFLDTKTNGNPLFVTDAINFYLNLDLIQIETDQGGKRSIKVCDLTGIYNAGAPPSVEGVCGAMLDRLSPIQQLLLKTCATCAVIARDSVVQAAKQERPELLNGTVIPNVFTKSLAISRFPIVENAKLAKSEFNELVDMGIIQRPPVTKRAQGSGRSQLGSSRSQQRRATVLTTFRKRLLSMNAVKEEKNDEYCFGIPWMLDSLLHRMLSSQRKKIERGNYQTEDDDSKTKHNETQEARSVIDSEKFKQNKKSFINRIESYSERSHM